MNKTIFEEKGLATRYGQKHKSKPHKESDLFKNIKVQKKPLSINELMGAMTNNKIITYYDDQITPKNNEKLNENNDEKLAVEKKDEKDKKDQENKDKK